jgi:hypothetical protein
MKRFVRSFTLGRREQQREDKEDVLLNDEYVIVTKETDNVQRDCQHDEGKQSDQYKDSHRDWEHLFAQAGRHENYRLPSHGIGTVGIVFGSWRINWSSVPATCVEGRTSMEALTDID